MLVMLLLLVLMVLGGAASLVTEGRVATLIGITELILVAFFILALQGVIPVWMP